MNRFILNFISVKVNLDVNTFTIKNPINMRMKNISKTASIVNMSTTAIQAAINNVIFSVINISTPLMLDVFLLY